MPLPWIPFVTRRSRANALAALEQIRAARAEAELAGVPAQRAGSGEATQEASRDQQDAHR